MNQKNISTLPLDTMIESLRSVLYQLIGFHKKLLEVVRYEKEALIQADLNAIEIATHQKQILIEEIHNAELTRLKVMGDFSGEWKIPVKDLTFSRVVEHIQSTDIKKAEQLRNYFQTITVLLQRIIEQNKNNKFFVERSLDHIFQMKKNVIQESEVKTSIYTQQGQKTHGHSLSRLISKEA